MVKKYKGPLIILIKLDWNKMRIPIKKFITHRELELLFSFFTHFGVESFWSQSILHTFKTVKDGNIEYENIKKKPGHWNGNIEKLLKSGELWQKMVTSNLTSKVPHKLGHIIPQNRSYNTYYRLYNTSLLVT
jgi:hypothetical protein